MDQENIKKRRSIRDIPISGRNQLPVANVRRSKDNVRNAESENVPRNSVINLKSKKIGGGLDSGSNFSKIDSSVNNTCGPKFKLRKAYVISSIFIVLILFVILSNSFAKSSVNVSLKFAEIQMNSFELDLIDDSQEIIGFGLSHKSLSLSESESISVSASQEELVRQKASGIITVYNEYSPNDQNWIQNTRFQSPGGLIYRTPNNVTIPSYTKRGDVIIPGQIDIEVVADEFGEKYNLSNQTRFTIPAFVGQDSYDSFYAISKGDIGGGFDGVRRVVSDVDLENAKTKLQQELRNKLVSGIDEQIPNNFLSYYLEKSFSYDQIQQQDGKKNEVILTQKANLDLILVDKNDLAKAIASNLATDYRPGEEVVIKNIDELDIKFQHDDLPVLVLSGNAFIEWQVNQDDLINDLLGKKTTDLKDVLIGYRQITEVTSEISPLWRNSFPNNPRQIRVVIQ